MEWTTQDELMAQLIEEVSVLTADRRRKEPRTVPRPGQETAKTSLATSSNGGFTARGLEGMLAAAEIAGAVR